MNIQNKILKLKDDQLAAIFGLVGIKFKNEDLKGIVKEIRKYGIDSLNLGILLAEGSQEDLIWWTNLFTKANK